jgi:precorrin-8X/cobalt-precorrin-8 methylmutase
MKLERHLPMEIEQRSFEIISAEMGETSFHDWELPIVKRVIHTTADFDYVKNIVFTHGAAEKGVQALREGATIVTDTNMAKAGINKKALERLSGRVECFMADSDVAETARRRQTTRAAVSMEKASSLKGPLIFAIGNAPTALVKLYELMEKQIVSPALVIGVPVGFVNVVEAKELILKSDVPCIVARGRKGGSNVAAAIINAMLYQLGREEQETARPAGERNGR